jgi:hypothetical protein
VATEVGMKADAECAANAIRAGVFQDSILIQRCHFGLVHTIVEQFRDALRDPSTPATSPDGYAVVSSTVKGKKMASSDER